MKYLIYYLLFINFIAYSTMWFDKRKAIKHQYRISEKTLLLLSLIGGSVGSLIAMFQFHHKNRKLKFQICFPLFLFIHIFILIKVLSY